MRKKFIFIVVLTVGLILSGCGEETATKPNQKQPVNSEEPNLEDVNKETENKDSESIESTDSLAMKPDEFEKNLIAL